MYSNDGVAVKSVKEGFMNEQEYFKNIAFPPAKNLRHLVSGVFLGNASNAPGLCFTLGAPP